MLLPPKNIKNQRKYTKPGSIYHALSFQDPREFVLTLNKKLCRFTTRIYYVPVLFVALFCRNYGHPVAKWL